MSSQRNLFGRVGLIATAAIFLIAVTATNILFRGVRLDLTENDLFTLSEGTGQILESIPEPINIYLFYSDRATTNIPQLRTYAGRVKETLQEFEERADGKIRLQFIDPLPFSENEDRAAEFGLQGINLGTSEQVYMGIAATNSVGDEQIIPFLDPSKESFLEYDLAKLVYSLASPEKPVVGLLTTLPMSSQFNPQAQQTTPPWVITAQIEQLFELRTLDIASTTIDADIDVLMVVHPKNFSDDTLYAIDQFIMRGGRALIFVDPYAEADVPPQDPSNPAAAMMANRSSSLEKILGAWGVTVPADQVVGDDRFALTVSGMSSQPVRHLGLIGIDQSGTDPQDIITSGLTNLNLGFTGRIEVADEAAATVTPLVKSSEFAGSLPATTLAFIRDPNQLRDGFELAGKAYILAARIQGDLPSAFTDGPPGNAADKPPEGQQTQEHLASTTESANVVLVADTDILMDRMWAQVQNFFGQQVTTAFANNGDFIVNALDNLSGSGELISVRGRQPFTRPFTRVQELRRQAEDQFRRTEEDLQQQLQETEAKLGELQASREDSSALILSPEQEAELERFTEQRLRIRKELRRVQRGLDESIESLGTMLKVINIGLVPVLISLVSLGLWFIRRGAN